MFVSLLDHFRLEIFRKFIADNKIIEYISYKMDIIENIFYD